MKAPGAATGNAMDSSQIYRRRLTIAAGVCFPIALWFVACCFLFGQLGLWHDDYYYVQRTPETLEIEALYLDRTIHVWRPLFKAVVPPLLTLFWPHTALLHLLMAAAHGLVAMLLWRLLWMLGVNRLSAGAAALLFLICPVHYEGVFWLSALPTTIATMLALCTLIMVAGWSRGDYPRWSLLLVGPAIFAVAALNEQPAMLVLALPVVAWAARTGEVRGSRPWHLQAMGAPLAFGVVAGIIYAMGHVAFVSAPTTVDHEGFVAPLSTWPRQMAGVAAWAVDRYAMGPAFIWRAGELATEAMGARPLRTLLSMTALFVGAAIWVCRQSRIGQERRRGAVPGHAALWSLGAVLTLSPWIPIIAFDYELNPRLCYIPSLGLATWVAVAGSALAAPGKGSQARARRTRALVAGAVAFLAIAMSIVMLGVQRAFQARAEQDQLEMRELQRLWPEPPAGTVFAPALIAPPSAGGYTSRLDRHLWGALSTSWSSRWCVRLAYRRSDVDAGFGGWDRSAILDADAAGVRIRGVGLVEWDSVAIFVVDVCGMIRAVTRVYIEEDGVDAAEFAVPLGKAAAAAMGQPEVVFELRH